MRRLYPDLLLRRLRRGDVAFPFRALRSAWGAVRREARPLLGTLIVTYRCDLECAMCDLPLRGDRKRELDTEGMKGVLDAFRDLGVLGVGITGGEPLLRPDLPDLLRHGDRRGLLMHVNTNGTLLNADVARSFSDLGVASVNVSLDGPTADVHDRLRGRDGSFRRVLTAIANLAAVPSRSYRIAVTCALGRENAGSARALLDRVRDVGADRVGFIPVHDFAAARVAPSEPAALPTDDPLVDNSPEYLALFPRAYRGEPNPVPCTAPRTSVVVDCYGDVYPCVPLNAARKPIGTGDVRRVWRSETYRRARRALKSCRACYWNCHTELNLTLGRLGAKA